MNGDGNHLNFPIKLLKKSMRMCQLLDAPSMQWGHRSGSHFSLNRCPQILHSYAAICHLSNSTVLSLPWYISKIIWSHSEASAVSVKSSNFLPKLVLVSDSPFAFSWALFLCWAAAGGHSFYKGATKPKHDKRTKMENR